MTHLETILTELASRIGQENIDPKQPAEWTKGEKAKFEIWLLRYMDNVDARKELMSGVFSNNSKMKRKLLFVKEFMKSFTNWVKIKEIETRGSKQ